MRQTTERLFPGRTRTVEEKVIDAMHRFAYSVVKDYARPTDRLLEIGFGEGYGSAIVAEWVGEYVGVEIEPAAVAHATEAYGRPNRSFVLYDGVSLPFEVATFDLVIAFQVIEHVPEPEAFLREAERVTRPGRPVLIVTPNRNHRVADGERPWNRYHVREFSPGELETVIRAVFESVEVFGIHGSPAMDEIERRRVARARRLARLDPLGLRYALPEGLDARLRTFLRRRSTSGVAGAADPPIGVDEVRCTRERLESSLDLLAVGRAA